MPLYRIPVEHTVTFKRVVYVEAPSKEEAHQAVTDKARTLTYEQQEQEYYVKTPVPVSEAPRVDIIV